MTRIRGIAGRELSPPQVATGYPGFATHWEDLSEAIRQVGGEYAGMRTADLGVSPSEALKGLSPAAARRLKSENALGAAANLQ